MILKFIMSKWNTHFRIKLVLLPFLLLFIFLSCDEKEVVKEVVVARVGNSSLTENELHEHLGEKRGIAKYRDEYIRYWVENELLYQFAKKKNLLTDENFYDVIGNSSQELAANIAINEYLTNQKFNYSKSDLRKYYQDNKDDFSFGEDGYLINMISFNNEPKAISFRNYAIREGWNEALSLFEADTTILNVLSKKLFKLSEVQSKLVSRVLTSMFKGEISVVVNTELNNFVIVQQLDKINRNSIPKFEYVIDDVLSSYTIIQKRDMVKDFIDSLMVQQNVKIY